MGTGQSWIGDVRCGLHSGFPRCCIRFFIGTWVRMSEDERGPHLDSDPEAGYVRCPACVASGHRVQVKPCPVGSHGGNVIDRFESRYERRGDRNVLVEVEYFFRDRPGSYRYPVVDGVIVHPYDQAPCEVP